MAYSLSPILIDTHCHLDFPEFSFDRKEVIQAAKEAGLGYIINIGSSLKASQESVALSKEYGLIYSSVGVHPHDADTCDSETLKQVRALAKEKKVVAIGEIGLDYFKNYSQRDNQMRLFLGLIALAKDLSLPVVIHSRKAEDDILKILKESMPIKAVIHCFSGDETFLKECLDLGFFISFTCNITYKKAENLRGLVKAAPIERMFLETDAPFLSPEGLRGKRNEPKQVKLLAEEIARIKEVDFEKVASVTTENAVRFFNLGEPG
ncbi:MAG: TatD family hydrolase [Candidatus Omnitrophota bacterium]